MKRKKELKIKAPNTNTSGIVLSIGMIVKDEIRSIERCLKALEPLRKALPCQLVIADTGSTDGTREIVQEYADICFDFEWISDFSAARNAVLDKCTGVWNMYVDADEYLDEDISELVKFLTHEHVYQGFFVTQRNYRDLNMKKSSYSDFIAMRIILASLGKRFYGAIHEQFDTDGVTQFCNLENTILHHDGYAGDREQAKIDAKNERNLVLLREEHKKDPESLTTLLQCIESSNGKFSSERMSYIYKGMDLLTNNTKLCQNFGAAGIYKHAQVLALIKKLPTCDEWLEFGKEHFSKSYYYKIDVMHIMAWEYIKDKRYEEALDAAEIYLAGIKSYYKNKGNEPELLQSAMTFVSESAEQTTIATKAFCLMKMDKTDEGIKVLSSVDTKQLTNESITTYLLSIFSAPEDARAQKILADLFDEYYYYDGTEKWAKHLMAMCVQSVRESFSTKKKNIAAYTLCSGDVGIYANIMQTMDSAKIAQLTEDVKDFHNMPMSVYAHLMAHGVAFPDKFYNCNYTFLLNTAGALAKDKSVFNALPNWVSTDDFGESLKKFKFLFDLTSEVLKKAHWKKNTEKQGTDENEHILSNTINFEDKKDEQTACDIIEIYGSVAQPYLQAYYSQDVLQSSEEWGALLPEHHFAMLFTKAQEALQNKDELGLVRFLRQGVKICPNMSVAVTLMLKTYNVKQNIDSVPEASVEMRQLAVKIKEILSKFDKNSPEVAQIMQSEAYMQVKHLIED